MRKGAHDVQPGRTDGPFGGIELRLLPAALSRRSKSFTLSAWLEPAGSVGGDSFDHCEDREVLHLSVTDAMGHGAGAAQTAALCDEILRGSRHQGGSLLEQAAAANAALVEYAAGLGTESFVTGLLGRLDLRTGSLALVNAGHVAPYLARAGAVLRIELPAGLPLGLFLDASYGSVNLVLEPGDRLVFVTDGMLERNAAALDLAAEIRETRALQPQEMTRRLAAKVLDLTGPSLSDDATVLVLDWHGHRGPSEEDPAVVTIPTSRRNAE